MPSWIMHFAVANTLCEKLNYKDKEKNEFIFANILPDLFEGHIVKNLSRIVNDYSTHFPKITDINGMKIPIPNVSRFKEEYINKLDNPIICGYLCHLLTDRFWNMYAYGKYLYDFDKSKDLIKIINKDGSEEIVYFSVGSRRKQADFKKFCNYIKNNKKIEYPYFSESILDDLNELKEFKFKRDDIIKTIDYIENDLKNAVDEEDDNYKMFTLDELIEKYNESIEYILDFLEIN